MTILKPEFSLPSYMIIVYTARFHLILNIILKNFIATGCTCQVDQVVDMPWWQQMPSHGPLTRYAKLRVAHAPGMPETFSPPPRFSDPDIHNGTCVTQVPWCMPGSLTSGFLWSRWRGKRSRHSKRMCNPQFYVSDKRSMEQSQRYKWKLVAYILRGKMFILTA